MLFFTLFIKKQFKFLLDHGFKFKKYSWNSEFEYCFTRKDIAVDICGDTYGGCVDIIIEAKSRRCNLLDCELFTTNDRKELAYKIEEVKVFCNIEPLICVYSDFLEKHISQLSGGC